METVLAAAITGIVGLVAGLALPWVRWEIEKRRQRHERRVQVIEGCRYAVTQYLSFLKSARADDDVDYGFEAWISAFPQFLAIKPHLSAKFIERLESTTTFYASRRNDPLGALAQEFLREVGKVEHKWGIS